MARRSIARGALRRTRPVLRALDNAGASGAQIATWVALGPSLLPRQWWMTAVNVGLSQAYGYLVGEGTVAGVRGVGRLAKLRSDMSPRTERRVKAVWQSALGVGTATAFLRSLRRQNEIAELAGTEPVTAAGHAGGLVAGTAGFGVVLLAARATTAGARAISPVVRRVAPKVLVPVLSTGIAATAVVYASDRLLVRRALRRLAVQAKDQNARRAPGRSQPAEPERSGSPASLESFDTLGRHGQVFVSDGPRRADIERVTGTPALEPIRAYAGFLEDREIEETAEAACRELVRAGGLERSVVVVLTGTGSGWVQEWNGSSIEYLTGGDCAIVSMQYSYLPSGLAWVSDRHTAQRAGIALFEAVERAVRSLPPEKQPKLYVGGESLGTDGGLAAFSSAADMLERTDGGVWIGTPRFTRMWRELVASSRRGSPEVLPIVDHGRHVRFVSRPSELMHGAFGEPYVPWESPRFVFQQHSNDPVVFWSPDLLWRAPRWVREKAGRQVSKAVNWYPWVTFWQMAVDMPSSVTLQGGTAHSYHSELLPSWAAVLGGELDVDYTDLQAIIRAGLVPGR
ncbi:alpha/beta-hydrolase family protein [Georgenia sp. Z1491]|uniref:alpha/beta-hydrolase family protein n=1 Tax=Georgenia sp. Z1491 TaxID=3416707 RepID=UPI003CFB582D